jgi:formylglycine-generating enzyme required for sulfatase activity
MKRVMFISGLIMFALVGANTFAATAAVTKEITDKTTGMSFVFVKGGCFQMGDLVGVGAKDESPVHKVCVGDYYLGKYEVTREQWQKVTGAIPGGNANCTKANCPVENIGWKESVDFIQALNNKSKTNYRLPTEAEWEYAARSGGKDEKFAGGADLDAVAWHGGNSGNVPHPVGQKKPNGLGLYDMTGNVEEWCSDWYAADYYGKSPEKNPVGPDVGTDKVMRGGHYADDNAHWLRVINRRYDTESHPDYERYGLRIVMPVR